MNARSVRELIMVQPSMRLEIRGQRFRARRRLGNRVRRITVRTTGVVMEHDRLVGLVDLVALLAEQLVRIGSATPQPIDPSRNNGELRRRL